MSALWCYLLITVCLLYRLQAEDVPDGGRGGKAEPNQPKKTARKESAQGRGKNFTEPKQPKKESAQQQGKNLGRKNRQQTTTPTTEAQRMETGSPAQCKKPDETMLRLDLNKEYYYEGDTVTVYCQPGYQPIPGDITCVSSGSAAEWDPIPQCKAQCKKPDETMLRLDLYKEYYYEGDTVTVYCQPGYQPIPGNITCVSSGTAAKWDPIPQCKAQCTKPTLYNGGRLTEERPYYNKGDEVTVECDPGYNPSSPTMRCDKPGTYRQWTPPTVTCTAQCTKPTLNTRGRLTKDQMYYNKGKEVRVECDPGYRPSSPTMTCDNPRTYQEWTPPTVTCTAQCAHPTITNMRRDGYGYKEYYDKGDVISVYCEPGYHPSSEYMRCDNPRSTQEWTPPTVTCTAMCKRPQGAIKSLDPWKEFYTKGESVTVNCWSGYGPSYKYIQCVNPGTTNEWDYPAQCNAQCTKPTIYNGGRLTEDQPYYNKGDEVRVECERGYRPSSATMTCDNPRSTYHEWTPSTVTCTEQCAHPAITHMRKNVYGYKDYYGKGEVISVQCEPGYYPSSENMKCDNPHSTWEWTPPTVTCTGVTLMVSGVTSTSISARISCNPECPDHWKFALQCCPVPYNNRQCKYLSGKSVTFSNLQSNSLYKIHAYWEKYYLMGEEIRTAESVPEKPEIIKVPSMEDKMIKWRLSEGRGAITGFQMNISAWREYNVSFALTESLQLPSNVRKYELPLQYGTNYTITLRGFTSAGAGEDTTQNIETGIGDPPPHKEQTINDVTVQLHPVHDLNGPIRSYEIIVDGQERNSLMGCARFNKTPYNSSWALSPYTAAVLPAENMTEPRTFTLGDDQHYDGFHNAPLIPKHNYTVYIRVISRWKQVEKSSCAFAGFLQVAEASSSASHIIAGSVSAVILLLLLLLLVILWKSRSSRKSRQSTDILLKVAPGKRKDIPVDDLLEVVKKFRKREVEEHNEDEEETANVAPVGRYKEYRDLPSGFLNACTVAQAEENKAKNRYKKVLPYDDSRVVLRSSRSDYINASYVDGYRAPKFFIATQGPLPDTLADFWSMVWQENSSVIVMLTGLKEQNKVKCECYWPEQSQTYGDITVSVQKIIQTGAITIRSFSLKKAQSTVQITVEQLHYLRWPDHGVPKNTSDLIQLTELMNKSNTPGSGPVIVHCSAGIGRTGTFMALDVLLKMAHAVKKVNVYNCVSELRKKRVKMVQEKEQYVFLYNALLEGLLCGNTIVLVSDIQKRIAHMSVRDGRTKLSGYDKEFQVLQKLSELYQIYQCKEGKKPENQEKNRYPNILPGDHWRPVLMSALNPRGAPGYINAVFVNSNSQEDVLITTQLPTSHTLNDFWAMVWDYKCTSMVMMQRAQDLKENGLCFFPDKGEASYGIYKVRKTAKTSGNGYSGSTFHLMKTDQTFENSMEVKMWQLNSWPLDKPIPDNPAAIINLIGEVEKCPLQVPGSHILVICCDGASRSGLFCAGVIICDQIRSDGCLDVSQAVRSLRRRRCHFIPTVEQYSFCYTLAQSYMDSFETYGNFK